MPTTAQLRSPARRAGARQRLGLRCLHDPGKNVPHGQHLWGLARRQARRLASGRRAVDQKMMVISPSARPATGRLLTGAGPQGTLPDAPTPILVEVRDATVVAGGRTKWSHLTATVSAAEFVAILGTNAAGKSTLLNVTLGLLPLSAQVITSATLTALYGTPVEVLTTAGGRLVVVGQPEAPARHTDRHARSGGPR